MARLFNVPPNVFSFSAEATANTVNVQRDRADTLDDRRVIPGTIVVDATAVEIRARVSYGGSMQIAQLPVGPNLQQNTMNSGIVVHREDVALVGTAIHSEPQGRWHTCSQVKITIDPEVIVNAVEHDRLAASDRRRMWAPPTTVASPASPSKA